MTQIPVGTDQAFVCKTLAWAMQRQANSMLKIAEAHEKMTCTEDREKMVEVQTILKDTWLKGLEIMRSVMK